MDPKDLKSRLKEAKTCAKTKDWNGTLKAARDVLRYENENYMALVLQGLALNELKHLPQSLESYRKACKIKPKDLLAWQGIATHLEKSGDKKNPELLEVYKHITAIWKDDKNAEKYLETILKHAGALQSQEELSEAVKVLQGGIKSCGHSVRIDQMLINIIEQIKGKKQELTKEEKDLHLSCLLALHNSENGASDQNYKALFPLLYQSGQFDVLSEICLSLKPRFNEFYYPIEYLCRLFVENRLTTDLSEMRDFVDKLFKLYPSCRFGYFARGKLFYEERRYLDAIAWLKEGIESKFHGDSALLLINAQLKIWDFLSAEDLCTMSKKNIANSDQLSSYHLRALAGQKKWDDVRNLLAQVTDKRLVNIVTAEMLADEEKWEEFDAVVEDLYSTSYSWDGRYLRAIRSGTEFEKICEENSDDLECLLKCGTQLMKQEGYTNALTAFNQALKLSTSHPIALFNTGKLLKLSGDIEEAKKYLRKAYQALPSAEFGSYLSDLYFELNDTESNKELLLPASRSSQKSRSKWASLRLGVLHLHLGEAVEAVTALQTALRADFTDCAIWETLADAYYARGSYEAASKAYQRCVELGADPVYPRLKIGVINGHLGLEEAAIASLKELGDYVPALVELSKVYLQVAIKSVQQGLDEATVLAVSEGLSVASRAVKNDVKQEILPLIVISHLVLTACQLSPKSEVKVPSCLVSPESATNLTETVNLKSLILIGIRVIGTALSKSSSSVVTSSLHSALSKLYFYLATKFEIVCTEKSVYHAKKAVSLSPHDPAPWNLLAVVAFVSGNKKLAQHCCIKSLILNTTGNPIAWCNLGFFYISAKDVFQGHKCFVQAQNIEPRYGRLWIGMGLIAENIEPSAAMELFQHASSTPDTSEFAGFAYSEWLAHYLEEDGKKLQPYYYNYKLWQKDLVHFDFQEGVMFGPDHTWLYNARCPSATSLNTQGIIQLHAKLNISALESFTKAAGLTQNSNELKIIRQNLIIALLRNCHYEKVLEIVQALPNNEQTFISLTAAAFASDKLGSLDTSLSFYEQALKLCSQPEEQMDTLTAQGTIAYKLGCFQEAKTLLFQGCQKSTNEPNLEGYLALCALGLLAGELDLASGALHEITKHTNGKNIHDVALMEACCLISCAVAEPRPLRSILSKIHSYPFNGKLRKVLAMHLINFHENGLTARNKLLMGTLFGERNELAAVAMTYLMEGDFDNAIKYSKLSLRVNLGDPASYAVLMASLVARGTASDSISDLQLSHRVRTIALTTGRCGEFPRIEDWFKSCEVAV